MFPYMFHYHQQHAKIVSLLIIMHKDNRNSDTAHLEGSDNKPLLDQTKSLFNAASYFFNSQLDIYEKSNICATAFLNLGSFPIT